MAWTALEDNGDDVAQIVEEWHDTPIGAMEAVANACDTAEEADQECDVDTEDLDEVLEIKIP